MSSLAAKAIKHHQLLPPKGKTNPTAQLRPSGPRHISPGGAQALEIHTCNTYSLVMKPLSMAFSLSTELCDHEHNQFWNILITLQRNPVPISGGPSFPPKPSGVGNPSSSSCLWICLFRIFHINGVTYSVAFGVWLSLSTMFTRFTWL